MRERYIAPAIMLIAGAITSILNIVNNVVFLDGLKRLLIVLIVFYALGKIVEKIIKKISGDSNKVSEEETITGEETITEEKTEDLAEDNQITEETADLNNQ